MFLYSQWQQLPLPLRNKIATQFGIAKTGSTHVQDNRVVSDGYAIKDVENALNIDAIQKFIGSEDTDFKVLWDALVFKIENPTPVIAPQVIIEEIIVVEAPKKRGRKPKVK